MDEAADPSGAYDDALGMGVAPLIEKMLKEMLAWQP
jgi:N-formylglutamate deformylase